VPRSVLLLSMRSASGRLDFADAFTGISNVKAHSLLHDLDDTKALPVPRLRQPPGSSH